MNNSLTELYYRKYRIYILPIGIYVASLFLFTQVAIPQYQAIAEKNQSIETVNQKIESLQSTLNAIKQLNSENIEGRLSTLNSALPTNKDIVAIYSKINTVAERSQVKINSFSIKVGGIYGKTVEIADNTKVPSLLMNISILSPSYQNTISFSKLLYDSLPLAEIKKFGGSKSDSSFDVAFYYKPYDLNAINNDVQIKTLSTSEQLLLDQLNSWKQ